MKNGNVSSDLLSLILEMSMHDLVEIFLDWRGGLLRHNVTWILKQRQLQFDINRRGQNIQVQNIKGRNVLVQKGRGETSRTKMSGAKRPGPKRPGAKRPGPNVRERNIQVQNVRGRNVLV